MKKIIARKNINLRLVELSDVDFILFLRTDSRKNLFLNQTSNDKNKQIEWLLSYKDRENKGEEFYFMIESKNKEEMGLVRLYDFRKSSFCWGSFLIKSGAPFYISIETVLFVYDFAFYELNFKESHFDVRKENEHVVRFHKNFGARIIDEDKYNFYFNMTLENYEKIKQKYKKFL
ncbi:TPA: GNAT family N-acetyltransferase [Campylobacter lari]|nr:GNAT family N-acetyltransferase [Campylobacter lari]